MLQDNFLSKLQNQSTSVSIFLVSGIQLKGEINAYNTSYITLSSGNNTQLIIKKQIACIQPNNNKKKRTNRFLGTQIKN